MSKDISLQKPLQGVIYQDTIPGASHWSMVIPAGKVLAVTDIEGGANVSMLFYNPHNLLERYNAPDTLKCQHTFKLTHGHCLYSDMGRIFCSIVRDDTNWIDSVGGVANKQKVAEKWGERNYQSDRNAWLQNGHDSLLVEVAKYGLGKRDLAANINIFSQVKTNDDGDLSFVPNHSKAGDTVELRFEMETLVVFTTCPHPMNPASEYPNRPVSIALSEAPAMTDDDKCLNSSDENGRGFENNRRYNFQQNLMHSCQHPHHSHANHTEIQGA
ncbi:urea carboxylase-associated family protein [Colwellia sp. 1_MG-2023]|uniref:urea amidolyase associated protein UAAP1 n=1 Tax=unclassified Colwellia TaxID=196834 RepID=UPI001C0A59A0|nr:MULTISPECIES: urea amidolyase associated protein UAAP1 [unclassified Colwellia]MBU2924500.1 urea carboxylase-associated family protein [Colwellia sp. C2M11]MDO6652911.1 urea carboxylase-associated family protein [Colwellia sp. 3_MG-2023]MDO6665393.1 urea carboxylase-associated family protein [Colwellia sp. 2_MG-2023]MDO6689848.1 urea carboxylase-associated family protein [Colwellia sp. 1_MG-2023]